MPPADSHGKKIRVLVVDDVPETRENVRKLLFFEDDIEIVGTASNGREGVELTDQLVPDIVLMDINMPEMDGIAASEAIAAKHHDVQIVMMSVQGEADYLRRSMLAGAREFLIKPFSSDELATSIRRVHELAAQRRALFPAAAYPAGGRPPELPQSGEIIAVFGSKGGCGATTIAVNLAVALREETRQRVALFDANFEMGDIGVMLNVQDHHSIADLTGPKVVIDEEVINGVMATHASGVKALLGPPRPEMAELVTLEHLKNLVGILSRMFDYVVIDVCRTFQEPMVSLLDAADKIILVTTSDIPAIKNAKSFFELTHALGYPAEKTLLVLNKEDGRSGIGVRDIESSIKHSVMAVLPKDERTTLLALNRGTPFVSAARRIPLSQALLALARMLCRPVEQPPAPVPVAPAVVKPMPASKQKWFLRK